MAELDRLYVRVLGDITDLKRKMSKAERVVEQFGYNMAQAGKAITAGLTLPLAAAGAAATKLASDAAEAANKFDVVFGASAERARDRIAELHATIPLTSHEMEGLSASLQDMLVPMGLARSEAADLSIQFLELGADIASFNNISTQQALEALRSGLAGEAEPLRRFGVDVRVARLEALALEEGLIGVGDELDRTAQAQAVFLAVQRDSKDAIGDAARTADEAANSFRFFWRNVKELGVTIGKELLPVITPLVNKMNDMISAAGGLSNSTVQWTLAIAAVVSSIGPLLLILGKLLQLSVLLKPAIAGLALTFGMSTGGLGFVVAGVVAGLGYLATAFVKSKLEAAALRSEMEDLNEAMMQNPAEVGASLRATEAQLVASQQRLAALKVDLEGRGGRTANRSVIQQEFNTELANMIALATKAKELRAALASLQAVGGVSSAVAGGSGGGTVGLAAPLAGVDAAVVGLANSMGAASLAAEEMKGRVVALSKEGGENLSALAGAGQSIAFAFSDSLVDALTDARSAFSAFVNYAINQLLRLAAQMAVLKGLELLFGGMTGGVGGYLGGLYKGTFGGAPDPVAPSLSKSSVIDLSAMPPASNPLASMRDAEWLTFLAGSQHELAASGAG